ncbi:CaaX prenyl protein-like proteinase Rce1 [Cucurbitaria berberidis CBS 394.84]|uniref:intramembrane prenyl-peptidase Rce1 n=1 Tax=Cucurbitaria berberidis CBS 394.84 TaxID=1168544 RepID=A0A9P4GG06_9PLEO|nr:CaaX prenyl protein-like proteinase Rce1 [Cucurbitaria berberidis CBS 394.84]KAF1844571.1 CaaX prenyl protein-like proteinase Rce1 [Cucurbitaria berberidis CBS 394.84]
MSPPMKGWRDSFSALGDLYQRHVKGSESPSVGLCASLSVVTVLTARTTHTELLLLPATTSEICRAVAMKTNAWPVPKAPAISPSAAALLSAAYVFIYVIPFYLSPATRPSPTLTRDAPSSIRARTRAVTFSTIVCSAITVLVLYQHDVSATDILRLLGLWPASPFDTARSMLLVAILFAGPIFEQGVVDGDLKDWIRLRGLHETLSSWIGYRNLVVGPVSEELVWRSFIVPLHVLAHFSEKQIVFLTPLYFGIAHLHHLYEFRITHPEVPLFVAVLRSLFQFTYTSLFGFFAAFVYIRTGNVYTCMLAHTFCNWMGLPRFYGRVGVEAGIPIGPPDVDKKDDEQRNVPSSQGTRVVWTAAYYVILVAGAVGFYYQLFPLTESSYALPVVLTAA